MNIQRNEFYAGLPAQFYDFFFQSVDQQELNFFAKYIKQAPAPALEIACGTGRVLLPLCQQGLQVEGFDSSMQMLDICRQKAKRQGITPMLYQQKMQELQLAKRYGCLFSPLGSFQHCAERDQATQALQNFYDHLVFDGILLIYLYVPWHNAPLCGQWHADEPVRLSSDTQVIVHEKAVHDPIEQLLFYCYRYEIWQHKQCIAQEEKALTIRWYSRYEFELMLKLCGFKEIEVFAGYEDTGPFEVMLFKAVK